MATDDRWGDDFPIWTAVSQCCHAGNCTPQLSLSEFRLSWDELAKKSRDAFRKALGNSAEYAVFFLRALSTHTVSPQFEAPGGAFAINPLCFRSLASERPDYGRLAGADLVARISLEIAWEIWQSGIHAYPSTDHWDHPLGVKGSGTRSLIKFVSADFIMGTASVQTASLSDGTKRTWYQYENKSWLSHGWKEKLGRVLANAPYDTSLGANELQTLLGFPAFFQHDAGSPIYYCIRNGAEPPDDIADSKLEIETELRELAKQVEDSHVTDFWEKGISPYLGSKKTSFSADRLFATASMVLCLGIARQQRAYFDPKKFDYGYGVFITIDFQTEGIDKGRLETISNRLTETKRRFQYKVLQVLVAKLVRELEAQQRELQKYKQMFDLLATPLHSLTEALAQTQADTQELRAIIYEPLDAIFACQPQVAELFDETKSIPELGWKPEHVVDNYEDVDKASSVLALALARFRGLSQVNGACNLLTQVSFFYQEDTNLSGPYHELSKRLRKILGIDSWDVMRNISLTDAKKCLNHLKERFFTAYKPREAQISPLQWVVLNSFMGDDQVKDITCKCNNDSFEEHQIFVVVAKGGNPLCTHGHLIEFICGVVGRQPVWATFEMSCPEIAQPGGISLLDTKQTYAVKFILSLCDPLQGKNHHDCNAWIKTGEPTRELVELLNKERELRRSHAGTVGQHGNFHAPFIKLIRRIPDELVDITEITSGDGVTIRLSNSMTMTFQGSEFILESKQ